MWSVLRIAARDWMKHRVARLGAALAYYSVFSLGPLLLIVVSIAGLFFGDDAVRTALASEFRSLLGPLGSQAIETLLRGAGSSASGALTAAIGVVFLLVAAVGVVAQLKDAINTIWETREPEGAGVWWYLRTYLISLAGVLGLGFLLAVSLVISTILSAISSWLEAGSLSMFWQLLNFGVSLGILTLLFALFFRWFPDAPVAWNDAWIGGLATAVLFNVGKLAIAWYVASQALESTYGAAASVVVLLIWVYYSAQIVLFGAEITHVYARRRERRPDRK